MCITAHNYTAGTSQAHYGTILYSRYLTSALRHYTVEQVHHRRVTAQYYTAGTSQAHYGTMLYSRYITGALRYSTAGTSQAIMAWCTASAPYTQMGKGYSTQQGSFLLQQVMFACSCSWAKAVKQYVRSYHWLINKITYWRVGITWGTGTSVQI